jgi:hypothetical protein
MDKVQESGEDQSIHSQLLLKQRREIRVYISQWAEDLKAYKKDSHRINRCSNKVLNFIVSEFDAVVKLLIGIWRVTFEEFSSKLPSGFWTHCGLALAQKYKNLSKESKLRYEIGVSRYKLRWISNWKDLCPYGSAEIKAIKKKKYYDSCEKEVNFYPLCYHLPEQKCSCPPVGTSDDISTQGSHSPSNQIGQMTGNISNEPLHYSTDQDTTLSQWNISGQTQEHSLDQQIDYFSYDNGLLQLQEDPFNQFQEYPFDYFSYNKSQSELQGDPDPDLLGLSQHPLNLSQEDPLNLHQEYLLDQPIDCSYFSLDQPMEDFLGQQTDYSSIYPVPVDIYNQIRMNISKINRRNEGV